MRAAKTLVVIGVLGLCFVLAGCFVVDVGEFAAPAGPPPETEIYKPYYSTEVDVNTAADVLAIIHRPEYELLSQSKSVIASQGTKKRGHEDWFNIAAFDEDKLTVQRKYLFIYDARPKYLFIEPWEGFRFHSQMVIPQDVLSKPYANENAKRIAILKDVLANVHSDSKDIAADNKKINIYTMMINQSFEDVLLKLKETPALAARLNDPNGVEFDHMSMDKGKIQMQLNGDIATVKLMAGSFIKNFKDNKELKPPVEDANNTKNCKIAQ